MNQFNKKGIYLALISFSIGTFLLLGFILTKGLLFAFVGLYYIMLAEVVNLVFALILLYDAIRNERIRPLNLKTIGVMLLNIPIATLYFFVMMELI